MPGWLAGVMAGCLYLHWVAGNSVWFCIADAAVIFTWFGWIYTVSPKTVPFLLSISLLNF